MSTIKICEHCNKEFTPCVGAKGRYCSRICYNEVSSLLNSAIRRVRTIRNQQNYETNPKQCAFCKQPLSYKDRNKKFCNHSCSASYTNVIRGPKSNETKEKISKSLFIYNRSENPEKPKKPIAHKPNTLCVVCNTDTQTTYRKTCSATCYKKLAIRNSQINPNCGGQKHTHRSQIINIKDEVFLAESSYELQTAKLLNQSNIYWVRPKFFWYTDINGSKRRYYPDFYLPDYNLYLDPKNSYLIQTDMDKIKLASIQNNIFVVVIGESFINDALVTKLVGDRGNAPLLPACKTGTLLLS